MDFRLANIVSLLSFSALTSYLLEKELCGFSLYIHTLQRPQVCLDTWEIMCECLYFKLEEPPSSVCNSVANDILLPQE